mgnify:FL=1
MTIQEIAQDIKDRRESLKVDLDAVKTYIKYVEDDIKELELLELRLLEVSLEVQQ